MRHSTPTTGGSTAHSDRAAFTLQDWWLFAAVGSIWGSSFLLIKVGLDSLHPGFITWARVVLGAVTLLAIRAKPIRLAPGDGRRIWVLSVVWVGVPFTLFPLAEQHINSAATGLLNGATPFFATLFGAIWFGRRSGRSQKLGVAIGFLGVLLISIGSSAAGGTAPVGVAMALVATVFYGLAANLAAPLQQRYGSVSLMGRMLLIGSILTAPFGLIGMARSYVEFAPLLATTALGVVGTGIAFALMASLVGRVGGPRASFITYLIPLVALVLGAAFLSETVATPALAGTGLVLAASVLASRREN